MWENPECAKATYFPKQLPMTPTDIQQWRKGLIWHSWKNHTKLVKAQLHSVQGLALFRIK